MAPGTPEEHEKAAREEALYLVRGLVDVGALVQVSTQGLKIDIEKLTHALVTLAMAEDLLVHMLTEHLGVDEDDLDKAIEKHTDTVEEELDRTDHEVTHQHEGPVDPMGPERREKWSSN